MRRVLDITVGLLLAAAAILLFRESLAAMVALWDVSPMYSYGYTVPPISAFLLWSRKEDFERQRVAPSRTWGSLVIAAAVAALAIGQVAAIQVIQQLAFILLIAGVVLYLFGRAHLQIAAPALGYLLFMVPMWDAFTEPLHWPFQNNSAKLGVAMIQAVGIPVHREGTIITLPNVVLEVARECSGVNYLVAVLALALPLSLLRLRQTWRRVALIVASLAVAALANGLRVALIGTLAYLDIGSPLHGPLHVLHGLFVAVIGYVVLFAGLHFLQEDEAAEAAATPASAAPVGSWRLGEAGGLSAVLLALAFIGVIPQAQDVVLAQPLETLPVALGRWTTAAPGREDTKPGKMLGSAWANADQRLVRRYRSPAGTTIVVEVFYYASQRQGREVVSSTSSPLHVDASRVAIRSARGEFSANVIDPPDQPETGLFWYDLDGHAEAGELATKLSTMWRAITSGRTNGAVVVLRAPRGDGAAAALLELAAELQPALAGLFTPAH